MWACCSIFPEGAGWDLAAATHICTDRTDPDADRVRRSLLDQPVHRDEATHATIDGHAVLTLLDALVDKHIVVADTTGTRTRYRMLETLRLFGQDALHHQRGQDALLRRQHSDYYYARIHKAARSWFSPDEPDWLEWAEVNLPNLRTTYQAALSDPDRVLDGVKFAANMARLRTWFFTGSPREGIAWLERGLAELAATHPTLTEDQVGYVVTSHAVAGWIALWQGRSAESYLAACHTMLGRGPTPAAVMFVEGTHRLLAHADPRSIDLLATAGEGLAAAGPNYRGDRHMVELTEATAAAFLGTRDQALQATHRCLANATAAGAPSAISWARLVRGMALMWHGDPDQAITLLQQVLSTGRAADDRWGTIWAIHAIAWALAEQAQHSDNPADTATTIAYLLGGVDRSRQRTGIALSGLAPFAHATTNAETTARDILGPTTYATAYHQGITAEPAAIVAAALDEPYDTDRQFLDTASSEPWNTLTPAEQDVARLAAQGLRNSAIAERRNVSERTVETQMTAVLRGLGVNNRHQITRMIPPVIPGR